MNCADFNREIELYVLEGQNHPQFHTITGHLSKCHHCRAQVAKYRALMQKIRENAPPNRIRLDFVQDLRSILLREEISRVPSRFSRQRLRFLVKITAICAVAGMILTVGYVNFAKQTHFSTVQIRKSAPNNESDRIVEKSRGFVDKSPEFVAEASEGSWRPVWQCDGARAVTASSADEIAWGGDRVYVVLDEEGGNRVAAYEAGTGQPLWRVQADRCGFLTSDAARVYGVRALSTGEFALTAWEGETGQELWQKRARNPAQRPWRPSKPMVLQGNGLCWTTCNRLHRFRSSDGQRIWSVRFVHERFLSEAICVGSRLYVAGQRNIYGVDAETGKVEWQLALGKNSGTWRPPLLAGKQDRVFVAQETRLGDSRLTCVHLTKQEIAWETQHSRISHLCASDERLYVRSQEIQALEAETGREVWNYSTAGCGPVTYAQQTIYFTDTRDQGCLLAVHGRSGEKVWQWSGVTSCNTFLRIGNLGILKTNDGTVHAIRFQG